MKFLILFILLTFISAYPQNVYPIQTELGRLSYSGNYVSPDSAMDKLFYGFPRCINFSISPDWRPKYPNPFSPSVIPNNAFFLIDSSDIKIMLLSEEGETLFNFYTENNPPGYYVFTYNWKLSKVDSLLGSEWHNRLKFMINDSNYVVPLIPH